MGWYRRKQNDKTMGFGVSLTLTIPLHRKVGGIKKKKVRWGGAKLQSCSPASSSHTNNNTRKDIHHCGAHRYF